MNMPPTPESAAVDARIEPTACPFCGAAGEYAYAQGWHGVGCQTPKCPGVRSALYHRTAADAIAAWNRRALSLVQAAQAQQTAPFTFCWLVELRPAFDGRPAFPATYYAGWMEHPLEAAKTTDPLAAARFERKEDAERVAAKLGHTLSCVWRAIEHGFAVSSDLGASRSGAAEGGATAQCWCHTCRPLTIGGRMEMIVCPDCGNKRCPKANDHRNACTNSNKSGQPGSAYPEAQMDAMRSYHDMTLAELQREQGRINAAVYAKLGGAGSAMLTSRALAQEGSSTSKADTGDGNG